MTYSATVLIEFDRSDIEMMLEMLREYRGKVADGEITGFGQSKQEELNDINELIQRIERQVF